MSEFFDWDWKADLNTIGAKFSMPIPKCDECEWGDNALFLRFKGDRIDAQLESAVCVSETGTENWRGQVKMMNDTDRPIQLEYVMRRDGVETILCEGICPVGEGWQTIRLESTE